MNFINIRVFFKKEGNAKYISHLDLYRAMGRAIKRSSLPVWVTEGFNPHIYMTFALPLTLGVESECESMDIRFLQDFASSFSSLPEFHEHIKKALDKSMPDGLEVTRVDNVINKASSIAKAKYLITTKDSETLSLIDEYMSAPSIIITKKTKKSINELDIKPLIKWEKLENQGELEKIKSCGNGESVTAPFSAILTLPAGNTLNINPWNALPSTDNKVSIKNVKRIAVLCENGEDFR